MRKNYISGLLFGLGLWYAASVASGEYYVNLGNEQLANGDADAAFISYIKANASYPLASYIRERQATATGLADHTPPRISLRSIDDVISNDPNNAVIIWYGAVQALREPDLPLAMKYIDRLIVLGKDWPETKNAEEVYAAVLDMVKTQNGEPIHSGIPGTSP